MMEAVTGKVAIRAAVALVSTVPASVLASTSIAIEVLQESPVDETADMDANWSQKILDEYPTQAIIERLEGTVGLEVTITAEGRVSACQVVQSSGHPILDQAGCASFMRHARYYPALDVNGSAVESRATMSIVYRLAD